jgi:hypothetical protein
MEEKLYTYGREEAVIMAQEVNQKSAERGGFSMKYTDLGKAIQIMREFREKKGLGNKVEIQLKKEVRLRKQATYQKTLSNTICPFTRITFGKFRGINPRDQVPQWSSLILNEYKAFDLSNEDDAADWVILRLAPCIEGSATSSKYFDTHYWEFNDIRASNTNTVSKAKEIVKISDILDKMSGSEMLNVARILGFIANPGDENTLQVVDIQGFILDIAMADPSVFFAKYKDQNRRFHELITAGEATGLVQFSHTEGYSYMGNMIGHTIEEVVAYLRQDKNLFSILKNETVGNDILAKRLEDQRPEVATEKKELIFQGSEPEPVGGEVVV